MSPTNKAERVVLQQILEHPETLRTLSPSQFEQLIAGLLSSFGWDVKPEQELPYGDDDFLAVSTVGPGLQVTWLVECKSASPSRAIGVEEIVRLYGARIDVGASNALLATTGTFTQGAKDFAQTKSDLRLVDYDQVVVWLKEYKRQSPTAIDKLIAGKGQMNTHFRASPPLAAAALADDKLGLLANLPGTWVGEGFNLVFLPDKQDNRDFRVKFNMTRETLVFTPIGGPIPNRGSAQEDIEFFGLHYLQRVSDAVTNEALHIEPGIWLNVPSTTVPAAPSTVVRQATIPHGDSLLAVGKASTSPGGPQIGTISSTPVKDGGGSFQIGYLDPFLTAPLPPGVPAVAKQNPNAVLTAAITGQTIVNTVVLNVSTAPDGGIVNMPFVAKNANPTSFSAVFWIETVANADGSQFMQLQYSQTVNLDFLGISWPHISVATLVKQ